MTKHLTGGLLALLALALVASAAVAAPAEASVDKAREALVGGGASGEQAIPLAQTETPGEATGTVPTEGVEDTLPWWLLALPLLAVLIVGLMVRRRPAMEKPQTADPIAPQTMGASMTPVTDRKPAQEESPQFEERD